MPEISLPDIKLPDVRIRDRHLPDVRIPDIDLRDRMPAVDLGHLRMPEMAVPAALRDVSFRDVSLPSALRDVSVPNLGRDVHLPSVDDVRRVRLPEGALRRLGRKPKRRGAGMMPWVAVTGMASAFAAWWLWTSAITGPRVRAAVGRARRKIDRLRAVDGRHRGTQTEAEPYWSSPDGWRTAGEDGGSNRAGASSGTPAATGSRSTDTQSPASRSGESDGPDDGAIGGTGFDSTATTGSN
ncbi:MAG TPA: hypothetical protein VNF73_13415 [Candidatus Saccharimonadales bacterium]|nr:hypothetical protein [Candidatus Saccharimonadales bacterium]